MLVVEFQKSWSANYNSATLPLLTSCIAASEKFDESKQILFGDKELAYTFRYM